MWLSEAYSNPNSGVLEILLRQGKLKRGIRDFDLLTPKLRSFKGNLEHESIKVNYRMAHIGMGDGRYLDRR